MKINRIALKNFGPHKSTDIRFDNPITAIIGSNGVGKTFLIEAVPACLFGVWPSRGNIADGITLGHLGDAIITIEFELMGTTYEAERKLHKTPKSCQQDAYLFSGKQIIAGPKVTDFEQAIENLLGDGKLFFSSVFSSQGNVGDIVESRPSDRKALLSQILEISRFQEKSDEYGRAGRGVQTKLDASDESILQLEQLVSPETSLDFDSEIERINENEKKVKAEIDQLQKKKDEYFEKFNHQKKIKEGIQFFEDSIRDFKLQKNAETQAETRFAELKHKLDEHKKAELEREAIIVDNSRIEAENATITAIQLENAEIQKSIDMLTYKNQSSAQFIIEQENKFKQTKRDLERRTAILDTGDYSAPQCQVCKFVSDAFEAKKELTALKEPDLEKDKSQIESAKTQISGLTKQIKTYKAKQPLQPVQPSRTEAIHKIQDEMTTTLMLKSKNIGLDDSILSAEKEIADRKTYLEDRDFASLVKECSEEIENRNYKLTILQEQINSVIQQKNKAQLVKDTNEKIKAQIAGIKSDQDQHVKSITAIKYLQRAFGKSGIQALLVDSALPMIQAISDQLLQIATNGTLSIEFSTMKENKDGSVRESLEILCSDQAGTRDVSDYSGGEQKILRSIIRLTLAIFQAKQSKRKLETLIIDEALDALDPENAEKLLTVFRSVVADFSRIIFISHSDELLVDFPNKIQIEKKNGVTVCV